MARERTLFAPGEFRELVRSTLLHHQVEIECDTWELPDDLRAAMHADVDAELEREGNRFAGAST